MADKDQRDVQLLIRAFQTADKKTRILQVLAPLGVLLPKGLGLFVDGKDIGRAYFLLCRMEGCEVEVSIDDDLMKTLESGKQAVFTIYRTQEAGIGFPVDLKGFGEGFAPCPEARRWLSRPCPGPPRDLHRRHAGKGILPCLPIS